ncbi:hypothetical protein BGZ65_012421, partial [Modicella reniformis]
MALKISDPTSETAKRLKMTVETEHSSAEQHPPSMDVLVPSKPSTMSTLQPKKKDDIVIKGSNGVPDTPTTQLVTTINTALGRITAVVVLFCTEVTLKLEKRVLIPFSFDKESESSKVEDAAMSNDATAQSNPGDVPGQDLAHINIIPITVPSIAELNDSILAVASLSEPLTTTLEMLENEMSAASQPKESSTSTTSPRLSPVPFGNVLVAELQDPASTKSMTSEGTQQPILAPSIIGTSEVMDF